MSDKKGLRLSPTLENKEKITIKPKISKTINFCVNHDFIITIIDSDLEFFCLKDEMGAPVSIIGKKSHARPAERSIHTENK